MCDTTEYVDRSLGSFLYRSTAMLPYVCDTPEYVETCHCVYYAGMNTRRVAGLESNCSGDCSDKYVIIIIHVVKPL